MASNIQYTSSNNPNNQPDLSNDFYLLHLDNQKLAKEVQDLKQIIQSLMPTINKLLNEQNPQKQQNQQTSSQDMKRQITQIEWNLRQKFDQRVNQLEQMQLIHDRIQNQEECRIRPSPIRKQKKMQILQKIWTQGNQFYRFKGTQYYEKQRRSKSIQNLMRTK